VTELDANGGPENGLIQPSGFPDDQMPDLAVPRTVHVVGVGGAGMGAIAEVLNAMGHTVSGSDLKESAGLDRLRALGVTVTVGHHPDNVGSAEVVTRSTAVPDINSECRFAWEHGVPVVSRAAALAAIAAQRSSIVVSGTHGKTTTSSMLALILREAHCRPSFIIGGEVNEVGGGAAWDEGDLFVVEGDESDGSFLRLPRKFAVVTNVEADHLEHHGGFAALREAFQQFVRETDGPVVVGIDDEQGALLAQATGATTVGTSPEADWLISEVNEKWEGVSFLLDGPDGLSVPVSLPVPGLHNARNAACATVIALLAGAEPAAVTEALSRFSGVARRFEHRGQKEGVHFVDDYAHLPTEVVATISAAKSGNWNRLVAVFQPHRYSRTEALWRSFGEAFNEADLLYVTDVYPSGEAPRPGVSGQLIVDAVRADCPDLEIHYVERRTDLVAALGNVLADGDCCLTMGAGDLTTVPDEVQMLLSGKNE